ncbi:host cell division inhibitor Icd-like protein [Klebsiella pneumoniae]|uniref:host cell division inhibitor Icd-like protein n=1 Tax=Klebsiella pneumoniae TaxID=573 RepID=UPI001E4E9510|nr:host cell division inhibitor Icd-like protein [Klebsiella pneumoniae]
MITAAQDKSLSMAGLMLPYSGFKNLAKISFPFAYKGNYFPHIAGGVNCIATSDSGAAWAFVNSTRELHHTCSNEFLESIKKGLMLDYIPVYGYSAPAKSGAGIGVLLKLSATHDAPSVFFCVVSSVHPFFSGSVSFRTCIRIMVGWAGASSEAPVSDNAGYANPVQSITSEIGVSGDGFNPLLSEAAIMATTPTQNPQFIWIIAAIRRDSQSATVKIFHVTAVSEREARRTLVRDHVCFFAGRIRLTEVDHA